MLGISLPETLIVGLPAGADPDGVSIVYLVSAFPSSERDRANSIIKQVPSYCLAPT